MQHCDSKEERIKSHLLSLQLMSGFGPVCQLKHYQSHSMAALPALISFYVLTACFQEDAVTTETIQALSL